jgi:hypothetical protein
MDILITDFISGINFGEAQSFKNLQIIPLFTEGEEGLVYLTLKEALEKRLLDGISFPENRPFRLSSPSW